MNYERIPTDEELAWLFPAALFVIAFMIAVSSMVRES